MDRPKLFYAPKACSLAAMITLGWAGIEHEAIEVSLASDRADLKPFNAEARVPTLVAGGAVVTESIAILVWAHMQRPQAALLPGGEQLVGALSLMSWMTSRLHIVRRQYKLPTHFSADPAAHASISANALPKYVDGLKALDRAIASGAVTAPAMKAYALVFAQWARLDEMDLRSVPALAALSQDLAQDAIVRTALRLHQLDA